MKPSLATRFGILACAGVLAFAAGCGGNDDPEPVGNSQQGVESAEERAAVGEFLQTFIRATKRADAKAFCSMFVPEDRERAFGTAADCVKAMRPQLKQAKNVRQFDIQNVEFDGDSATVTFKKDRGEVDVTKIDGKWYLGIPEQQASSVE